MLLSVSLPAHVAVLVQPAVLVQSGPSTTLPGSVVTITGSNVTTSSQVPGAHQDPTDLYGILLAFVAIAIALFATRWLFGRKGPNPYRPQAGAGAGRGAGAGAGGDQAAPTSPAGGSGPGEA